jgi:hypothetical protein
MHTLPWASAGIEDKTSGSMVLVMHQQDSAGRPDAIAHWLGFPQSGHRVMSSKSIC